MCRDSVGVAHRRSTFVGRATDGWERDGCLAMASEQLRQAVGRTGEQARLHKDDLTAISNAAAAQVLADQDKRFALEQRLAASDQTHHEALTNAQKDQARLRDRLATPALRLSVIIDATDSAGGCSVPAGAEAGGMVHGGARARLDPAHAQRIIGIIGAGDRG